MNNALKGALLSGLVLPGLGQVVLKHYRRGVVMIITVLASLAVIVVNTVQHALAILEQIEQEGGAIDMSTISNAATRVSTSSGSITVNILMLLIVVCWILAVVDAYLIGRKKDMQQRSPGRPSEGNNK